MAGVGCLLGAVLIGEGVMVLTYDPPTPDGYLSGVVTAVPFIVWMVYGSYRLSSGGISRGRYRRVAAWWAGGIVLFVILIVSISLNAGTISSPMAGLSTVRWSVSVGGGLGLALGYMEARGLERTFEAGQALAREKQMERERNRLAEFTSIISHDLRNPLGVATGRLRMARERDDSEHLAAVDRALDRMETIITDTLTLARQGEAVGATSSQDLGELAGRSWEMIQSDGATIEIDDSGTILADPERLHHVFENLFRNAIEHGGSDVTITLGRLRNGSGFFVEDDGPGLPEDRRDDVFALDGSKKLAGEGFGLAIVHRIVEAHGWDIRVTESEDGGARFEITGVEWSDGGAIG